MKRWNCNKNTVILIYKLKPLFGDNANKPKHIEWFKNNKL